MTAKFIVKQKPAGCVAFGRYVSISMKNYILGILTLRAIDWYMYGSNQGRWGVGGPPRGVQVLGGGSPGFFWDTSAEI